MLFKLGNLLKKCPSTNKTNKQSRTNSLQIVASPAASSTILLQTLIISLHYLHFFRLVDFIIFVFNFFFFFLGGGGTLDSQDNRDNSPLWKRVIAWVESSCPSACGKVWGYCHRIQRPPKQSHNPLVSYSGPGHHSFSKWAIRISFRPKGRNDHVTMFILHLPLAVFSFSVKLSSLGLASKAKIIFALFPSMYLQSTPDNSNLPLTRSNFHFPSGHFLYNFTLDNSNSR